MFYIAFDITKNKELLLYSPVKYKDGEYIASNDNFISQVTPLGSLLMEILNINFNDNKMFKEFIMKYDFYSLFFGNWNGLEFFYRNISRYANALNSNYFKLSKNELEETLNIICEQERKTFLTIQNNFLSMLDLKENKISNDYTDIINNVEKNLTVNLTTDVFTLAGIDVSSYAFPYSFKSKNIESILIISFKELSRIKELIIRQCINCGKYFVPENLNNTKYCNNIFQNKKTCQEVGKEITYKNSLKKDALLERYRKRYMSLSCNVSHYGTESAIQKFETYKKDGKIMKKKYENKEITPKAFGKWIDGTKGK